MAEKHKTKYKEPKDMAKSQKAETRKDIKDYTSEDNYGMVPNSTKQMQPLVARKYATEVIDDVENMVPEITDRLYKKVEEGEYTEGFMKKLERINHGAITNSLVKPENEETIKESISKLSKSEKEQVIRKYVRNKIAKVLRENYVFEQEDVEADDTEVDVDTPEVDIDTPDVDVDTPETDAETPDLGGDTTSFTSGGASSSPSPSPTPEVPPATDTVATTDATDTDSDTSLTKVQDSRDLHSQSLKNYGSKATAEEVGVELAKTFITTTDKTTKKYRKGVLKGFITSLRNRDIKIPAANPSDDYTKN